MTFSFRQQFATNGYFVFDEFIGNEEADRLKEEANKLIENMPDVSQRVIFKASDDDHSKQQSRNHYFLDSWDKISYFYEDGALDENGELLVEPHLSLNKMGHALHDLNPIFRQMTFSEKVKEVCFQLGFQEPVIVQSMYIFKNPGLGGEVVNGKYVLIVTPHQDASYLYTKPVKVVGLWIALEDATQENGCLKFINGSHNSGVHRRYIRNPNKNSDELLIYDVSTPIYQKSKFTSVPVSKGSCILIDGQVVHCSDPNKSSKSRHVYTFHVIDQKDTTYSEQNWIQPNKPFLNVYEN